MLPRKMTTSSRTGLRLALGTTLILACSGEIRVALHDAGGDRLAADGGQEPARDSRIPPNRGVWPDASSDASGPADAHVDRDAASDSGGAGLDGGPSPDSGLAPDAGSSCTDGDGDGYGAGDRCKGLDCKDDDAGCWSGACCGGTWVTLDYAAAASPGPIRRVAAGFLHGLAGSVAGRPIAPSTLYTALQPTYLRTRPAGILKFYDEDKRLRGGTSTTTMVATLSGGWGYPQTGGTPPWGANYDRPDYDAWLRYVVTTVNALKAKIPLAQRIYDFWNEPNGDHFWVDWDVREARGHARFMEMWRLTYRLIKEGLPGYNGGQPLDPQVRLTAPGTSVGLVMFEETFTTRFMQYAKDNDCVPDLWNWHFGDPHTLREFAERMSYAASIGVPRDALVLEYLREQDGKRPGRAIYELALLEAATHGPSGKRIIGATQARWPETTELGNALNYTGGAWRPTGIWHVYASYAKLRGAKARVMGGDTRPRIQAVAAAEGASKRAWAILGNDVFDQRFNPDGAAAVGKVTVRLQGVRAADSSGKVALTLKRIPYDNFGEVTDAKLAVVLNAVPTPVDRGVVTFTFDWGRAEDGYFLEVANIVAR